MRASAEPHLSARGGTRGGIARQSPAAPLEEQPLARDAEQGAVSLMRPPARVRVMSIYLAGRWQ
jgi:hypothetical protein